MRCWIRHFLMKEANRSLEYALDDYSIYRYSLYSCAGSFFTFQAAHIAITP